MGTVRLFLRDGCAYVHRHLIAQQEEEEEGGKYVEYLRSPSPEKTFFTDAEDDCALTVDNNCTAGIATTSSTVVVIDSSLQQAFFPPPPQNQMVTQTHDIISFSNKEKPATPRFNILTSFEHMQNLF